MRIAIHQPNFLPWLGFFHKASHCDLLVLLDDVQFVKRGFIHRNYIKSPTGKQWFGVPVLSKGRYFQQICETEINLEQRWQTKAVNALRHLYSSAPYFTELIGEFEAELRRPQTHLVELNCALLKIAFRHLGVTTPTVRASELEGVSGASTERLLSICEAVSATAYLSGAGGRNYQDEAEFQRRGIRLTYSTFSHPVYSQLHGDFTPNLSVIDYLFNVGAANGSFSKAGAAA